MARRLTPRLSWYGQYDYLRDLFAGIEHRNTVEGGVSYLLVDTTVHRRGAGDDDQASRHALRGGCRITR